MATKDNFLFFEKKHKSFNYCHTDTSAQYSDLNLNQNLKGSNIFSIQSNSKSYNNKKIGYTLSERYEEKEKSHTWKKSSEPDLCSKYSISLSPNVENEKCWKNGSLNVTNNSTLSLRISAYENSNEASSDSLNKSLSLFIQKQKQINRASKFVSQSPFEFQRQQNDKVPEPEMSQFKASQRLLNLNKSDIHSNNANRSEREKIGAKGIENVWSRSPTESDLIEIYKEHEKAEKAQKHELRKMELEEKERRKDREKAEKKKLHKEKVGLVAASSASESDDSSSYSDSEDKKKKKKRKEKKKKHKKEKKSSKKHKKKKKRKRRHSTSSEDISEREEDKSKKKKSRKSEKASEDEEEWVPVTKEMKKEEEQKAKEEEMGIIGPAIPEHLIKNADEPMVDFQFKNDASMKKDMLRGEAEAMAAYIAQGKRIPRRGEIGLSSDEITSFEKVGYVMSGTRHKAMEATRLRKENQIMTAEEKRMLSGFTHEQRKQKEDVVLQKMRTLIDSKKSKEQQN